MMRVAPKAVISQERAERIAKGHACEHCGEYSYKKLKVKASTPSQRSELKESWHVLKVCGVCGLEQEMGIDAEGEVLYVN
jgi:transcription elongation factor Elf1